VEVVTLIMRGLSDEEIGAELGVSPTEVGRLISAACEKAGASDRLGLIIYAIYHGYVPPPF
jgi:DNA-binding NarL/FixJ family response regulator